MLPIEKIVQENAVERRNKLLTKGHLFATMVDDSKAGWLDKFTILNLVFGMSLRDCQRFRALWENKKEGDTFMSLYFKVISYK